MAEYKNFLERLKLENVHLKPKQIEILDFLKAGGKDVIGILPTGYGKSLVYQMLPYVLEGTVIVFSPLSIIQEEQLSCLKSSDLKCCILNTQGRVLKNVDLEESENLTDMESSVPLSEVKNCDLVFAHPEALFNTVQGKELLRSDGFRTGVKAIVVDECHKVHDWGKTFRTAFQSIKDIPAFFPGVPRIALSATVTLEQESNIVKSLRMLNAKIVKESPDRTNITLTKIIKPRAEDVYDSYLKIYQPLCDELLEKGSKFPVTLVYMPLLYMGDASAYCKHIFKNPTLETCRYGMLCSGQDENVKRTIAFELGKINPRIRLVFCTSVVGMGFNSPCIERVIHCKPPRNLPDYVQEIGRAGRSGQNAQAILYYSKKDIAANIKDLNNDMINYCNAPQCLRDNLLQQFGFGRTTDNNHMCCSYCKSSCACFECDMFRIEL